MIEEIKILREFFSGQPQTGNQINIIIVGNTADLKKEIMLLQDAIRDLVGQYPKKAAPMEIVDNPKLKIQRSEETRKKLREAWIRRKARKENAMPILQNSYEPGNGKGQTI